MLEDADDMTKKRKIQLVGDSHYVSIPPKFLRKHKLKKGDTLIMEYDDESVTFRIPEKK